MLLAHITPLTQHRTEALLVAIDGRGGSGKSTVAAAAADRVAAAVIDGDDFYAGGTVDQWRAMTPADRAAHCIDWRRQRPVLDALRRGEAASWHPYDWEAGDGSLMPTVVTAAPSPVVILEGAYSARPELQDLIDLRVLLDVPPAVCRERIRHREGDEYDELWEELWFSAEQHYFAEVMPRQAFDVVLEQ